MCRLIGFWFLFVVLMILGYVMPIAVLAGGVYALVSGHHEWLAACVVGFMVLLILAKMIFCPYCKAMWAYHKKDPDFRSEKRRSLEAMSKSVDQFFNWFALTVCSGFFLSFLPGKILGKPGKGGGLAGSVLGLIILAPFLFREGWFMPVYLTVLTLIIGSVLVEKAEEFMLQKWGPMQRHTGEVVKHDFNQTCIDEVHGVLLAILPVFLIPADQWWWRLVGAIVAFGLFRFFDAKKIWLVGKAERRWPDSGFGIMFDDTVAGLMAAVCVLVPIAFLFVI